MPSRPHVPYSDLRKALERSERRVARLKSALVDNNELLALYVGEARSRHEFQSELEELIRSQEALALILETIPKVNPTLIADSPDEGRKLMGDIQHAAKDAMRSLRHKWQSFFPVLREKKKPVPQEL